MVLSDKRNRVLNMEGGEVDGMKLKNGNGGTTKQFTTKDMINVSKNICQRAQNPVKLTFKNINQRVLVEADEKEQ